MQNPTGNKAPPKRLQAPCETRANAIFEEAAVGVAVRAMDGSWLQVNRKLCAILGYTREELLATTSVALTPAEEREHAIEANRKLARGELESYGREKRYLHKNGHAFWVELSISLVRDAAGEPDYVILVIVDISARKAAQQMAGLAEARLRAALEHLGEMIVLTDAEDRIVIANRRFVELNAQVAEHTVPGRHYGEHLRAGIALGLFPDAAGQEESCLAERMALRHRPHGPVERRRQDGRWLMVDDQVLPDRGIISFGIEINERKRVEAALQEANQRLRLALEFSRVALWDCDVGSGALFLSEGWAVMLGEPPDETRATVSALVAAVHPDDRPAALRSCTEALKGAFRIQGKSSIMARWICRRWPTTSRANSRLSTRLRGSRLDRCRLRPAMRRWCGRYSPT